MEPPRGTVSVAAPLTGTVMSVHVAGGDSVAIGMPLLVLESMKMEHVVAAATSGIVRDVAVSVGDMVDEGSALLAIEEDHTVDAAHAPQAETDPTKVRPELDEVRRRHELLQDAARPDAVGRRHATGRRTARENLADLCDPGSFVEYGGLAIAAQRARRPEQDLIERTQADGLIGGLARVNGDRFADDRARCAVVSYDYTVLAGTQGVMGHRKKDRLFELIERLRLPVVLFAEGGGGRPGDTDSAMVSGLDTVAFALWAGLSGLVPRVGVVSGRCFAGNAALLGCSDLIIATEGSSIGMGGPAMIEGGGLGVVSPDEVGPMPVQTANGVVDVLAADDAEAVAVAKKALSYFQGPLAEWSCADQQVLRTLVPENRMQVYDVRPVIEALADEGSVLELRRPFALGIVTAFARLEGRPIGIVANNSTHLAGAITSDGADKAARFLQLCEAFDIPVLFLCDTPGIMVGPEAERTALVRHASRLFLAGAALTVPFFTIVLRKGYGLGAQAMAGGSFRSPIFTVAWPTGEFGGMGLEGAVKLAFRKEIDAIEDPAERQAFFERVVAAAYDRGKALNVATYFEIDDVIDPADSRTIIMNALRATPAPPQSRERRRFVDSW